MTTIYNKYKYEAILIILIIIVCSMHLQFLSNLDYVVYDHDQWRSGRQAIYGYWLLKDGRIKDFVIGIFGCWKDNPKYPNMVGYLLFAFPCYFLGLNEIVMRSLMLLYLLIFLIYIYLSGKLMISKKAGLFAVLIFATMPAVVFWSRTIYTNFFAALFFLAAFYHMLKSNMFQRFGHSVLFGLSSGLALLTHRVMFFCIIALWAITGGFYMTRGDKKKHTILNFIYAFILMAGISIYFVNKLAGVREPTFLLFPITNISNFEFYGTLYDMGRDNIFILLVSIIFFHIFKKFKFVKRNDYLLLCLIIVIFSGFTIYFYIIREFFLIIFPLIAVLIALYIDKMNKFLQKTFIFVKCLLLVYLFCMAIPYFAMKEKEGIFYKYYRNLYNYHGNGIIWSNMTFARKEELDYFSKEISEGNILIIDLSDSQVSVPLDFRLSVNAIGRPIDANRTDINAAYLIFYCISRDELKTYQGSQMRIKEDANKFPSELILVEKFINDGVSEELKPNKKIAMMDGYIFLPVIQKYIAKYNFVKAKFLKFNFGNFNMYKVIFKCTDRPGELINFHGYGFENCLLVKAQAYPHTQATQLPGASTPK